MFAAFLFVRSQILKSDSTQTSFDKKALQKQVSFGDVKIREIK